MFAADKGQLADSADLAAQALAIAGLEGISLLGGEPTEQAEALADFCERVREGGLSVMLYSGYRLDELRARPGTSRLLAAVDLLVDGRYEQSLPERRRRWLGSSNQQLHFLTPRYAAEDPRFATGNTVELRLTREGLSVNGWPASADAVRRAGR